MEDDAWPEEEEAVPLLEDSELPRLVLHPCTPVSDAGEGEKKRACFCHHFGAMHHVALLRLYQGFTKALLRRY